MTVAISENRAANISGGSARERDGGAVDLNAAREATRIGAQRAACGDLRGALDAFRQAAEAAPTEVAVWMNLATAARAIGSASESILATQRAVSLAPHDAELRAALGRAHDLIQDSELSLVIARQAVVSAPGSAAAAYHLARALGEVGDWQQALTLIDNVERNAPGEFPTRTLLADALVHTGDLSRLLSVIRAWAQESRWNPELHRCIAAYYLKSGDFPRGLKWMSRVRAKVSLSPALGWTLFNCYYHTGRYEKILSLLADMKNRFGRHPIVQSMESMWAMNNLNFKEAFTIDDGYHAIVHTLRPAHLRSMPRWTGSENEGQGVLLLAPDGGIGDWIQNWRFIGDLKRRAAFMVDRRYHGLFRRSLPFEVGCVELRDTPGDSREYCCLSNLPARLGLHQVDGGPYMIADAGRRQEMAARIPSDRPLRCGIAWRAGNAVDRTRNLDRASVVRLVTATAHRIRWVSLHQQPAGSQDLSLQLHWIPGLDAQEALVDTAALMTELDLIVSVDTSLAHLAGALGCPTWLLLRRYPDARWSHQGTSTPWYSSMIVFRQQRDRDWSAPVDAVIDALERSEPRT